ncbi:DUF397 domain-containing protein [Streptomyces shenzhenensis]|uniref:DUF397 domain-containing protein n=1 Tax=Streptomyces shenzhenensis TaxID=943815 RepID=UPI0015F04C60|nr:DUF397 domain-containing protein [Streptomyces shenzhenensis]
MTELNWQKSTYSEEASSCVEIAPTPTTIRIRDSKHASGPHLTLRPTAWADFVSYTAEPGRRA